MFMAFTKPPYFNSLSNFDFLHFFPNLTRMFAKLHLCNKTCIMF